VAWNTPCRTYSGCRQGRPPILTPLRSSYFVVRRDVFTLDTYLNSAFVSAHELIRRTGIFSRAVPLTQKYVTYKGGQPRSGKGKGKKRLVPGPEDITRVLSCNDFDVLWLKNASVQQAIIRAFAAEPAGMSFISAHVLISRSNLEGGLGAKRSLSINSCSHGETAMKRRKSRAREVPASSTYQTVNLLRRKKRMSLQPLVILNQTRHSQFHPHCAPTFQSTLPLHPLALFRWHPALTPNFWDLQRQKILLILILTYHLHCHHLAA
jgi:hypothetical protein